VLAHTTQSHLLNLALAWSLLAFGGVYDWSLAPLVAASAVLLVAARPNLLASRDRLLDTSLVAALAVIALQLIPIPRAVMGALSPGTVQTWDALSLSTRPLVSISVWPQATAAALATAFTAIALFWAAREIFRVHGVRRAVRTVALAGAIASFAGLLQRKSGTNLVYGFWQPLESGAWPFGPFINRNFFATWVVMAIPLCVGYLLARHPGRVRQDARPWRVRLAHALDGRAIWLMTVIGLMTVGLFASLSRSGVLALGAVLISGWAGSRLQRVPHGRGWALPGVLAVAATVVLWGDLPALVTRVEESRVLEPSERAAIWRDTVPLVRDHWLAGTGAGAYERAMLLYQTTDRTYYDNHAHSEYLQVAADGGLLLAIPVLTALLALVAGGVRQLRQDRTGMFWIRLGAAAGLVGVVVQSFWDTGLRAPGNAILSAVLAAILLHEPSAAGRTRDTTP
jgi:O-antigen ligase/polysaccharide polymerase Wzy-like membrane protein